MKKNDLLYSSLLSFVFLLLAYGYYSFYLNNSKAEETEIVNNIIPLDSIYHDDYDTSLIDTTNTFILSEEEIWSKLYPNKKSKINHFGGISKRAIMRSTQGPQNESTYFYTTIHRIFYYKLNGKQKAFVVLISYPFDYFTEGIYECHGCSPDFSIANWYYEKGEWINENFVENWQGGMGSWGQPSLMTFNMNAIGYTLEMDHSFCQGGYCEGYYVLYEIPSMKIIIEKPYTTNDSEGISDSLVEEFEDEITDSIVIFP